MVTVDTLETWARDQPEELLRVLRDEDASVATLTYAAEIAGRELPWQDVSETLLRLLEHKSPVVREGAVYGLSYHREGLCRVREMKRDSSRGVREAARDVCEEFQDD